MKEETMGITLNLVKSERAAGAQVIDSDKLIKQVLKLVGLADNPVAAGIIKALLMNHKGFYRFEVSFNGNVIWNSQTFYLT